jgi:tetratricopeptide (TPR) repeat protein
MRLTVVFLFCFGLLFSQTKKSVKTDSVSHYLQFAAFNAKVNNFKNSLNFTQKAIDYAHANHDVMAEAGALSTLGTFYMELKKYDDAIENFNRSIQLYNTQQPSDEQAFAYYNLGLAHMEKENYTQAEISLNRAKTIYETIKIPDAIDLLNLQKGIVYKAKGKYKQAATIFSTLIAKPDTQDTYRVKAEALYQMGTIEAEQGRNNLAINYMNRALQLNSLARNIDLESKIYKTMSSVYEDMSDMANAFSSLKKHLDLKETISSITSERLGTEDYNKFKENERLKTIQQMDRENQQQKKPTVLRRLFRFWPSH